MRFSEYIKDKILICLLHLLCMILLMGFFYITGYNRNAAALILIFWWIILGIWIVTGYYRRKKYFDRAEHILENVDQRYLLGELLPASPYLEDRIYRGQNLFLLRQFASKLKTMWFTMGTLTVLFMVAFLGCSVALMFTDWQNQVLEMKFPFDVQVNSQNPEYDFAKELDIVGEEAGVKDSCVYRIYENHTNTMNTWLYTHLRYFGDEYRREEGTPDEKKIRKGSDDDAYCRYDTYMGLSDYNHLRKMLGYSTETLEKNEYILQMKQRVYKETGDFTDDVKLQDLGETLTCRKICTESFSQDGHNGGDYIIVVPDERIQQMTPYYSELAVSVKKKVPDNLQNKLDNLSDKHDYAGHTYMEEDDDNVCYGTDTIVTYAAVNLVRENASAEVRYMMSCITFPCM